MSPFVATDKGQGLLRGDGSVDIIDPEAAGSSSRGSL